MSKPSTSAISVYKYCYTELEVKFWKQTCLAVAMVANWQACAVWTDSKCHKKGTAFGLLLEQPLSWDLHPSIHASSFPVPQKPLYNLKNS